MGRIDSQGTQKFTQQLKDDEDSESEGKSINLDDMSFHDKVEYYLDKILQGLVISRTGKFFEAKESVVTIMCLTTSYYYADLINFGFESRTRSNILEICFLIDLILNFFVDYIPNTSMNKEPERNFQKIALNYLRGNFIWDFIPLVPLQFIDVHGNERFFFIIK